MRNQLLSSRIIDIFCSAICQSDCRVNSLKCAMITITQARAFSENGSERNALQNVVKPKWNRIIPFALRSHKRRAILFRSFRIANEWRCDSLVVYFRWIIMEQEAEVRKNATHLTAKREVNSFRFCFSVERKKKRPNDKNIRLSSGTARSKQISELCLWWCADKLQRNR